MKRSPGSQAVALATAMIIAIPAAFAGVEVPAGSSTASAGPDATTARQPGFDRLIVKYNDRAPQKDNRIASVATVKQAIARAGLENGVSAQPLGARHLRRLANGSDLLRLERALDEAELKVLLAELDADPAIRYAQPDYLMQHTAVVPNDPDFSKQWHYSRPDVGIGAPAAWATSTGEGVVVAVLDTGYVEHADLDANIVPGYDFIADPETAGDGDGRDSDARDPGDWVGSGRSSFHGTHVAGTVAAVTNNGKDVAGVAHGAKVQPVRVLGHGGGLISDIIDAMVWASGGSVEGVPDNGTPAEVINMSLGGAFSCDQSPAMQEAIDDAVNRGVVVVVAAGNSDMNANGHSPASCGGVIAVGASGADGARSSFSNYGPSVTLSAPGGTPTSADPDERWIHSLGNRGMQTPEPSPAGDIVVGSMGTSMASPHVAGIVALMQSAAVAAGRPALTPAQVKTVLRTTARPFPVPPPTNKPQGAGIADAELAVLAALQDIPDDPGELLSNRIPAIGQSGGAGEGRLFQIVVPAGAASLNLRTYGGSGDVSLYVARDRAPTPTDYDSKSNKPGNSEAIVITHVAAGTYFLRVQGESPFADVSVLGIIR